MTIHSTTIICIRHKGQLAIAGDGQVTMGQTILKQTANKIRRLYKGQVLAGFAGATSDAFALFARFEGKLEEYKGKLSRAAIELAKPCLCGIFNPDRAAKLLKKMVG